MVCCVSTVNDAGVVVKEELSFLDELLIRNTDFQEVVGEEKWDESSEWERDGVMGICRVLEGDIPEFGTVLLVTVVAVVEEVKITCSRIGRAHV